MRLQDSTFWLLLVAVLLVSPATLSAEEEEQDAPKVPAGPTLVIGDKAPKLQDVQWLKGKEVPEFESGNVYVAEFWATWCGPCIASFPHLNALAEEYAPKGLVVVAITTDGPSNDLEKVNQFIEGAGKDYVFNYAFCDTSATNDAFMGAAQRNGIPCSFVIDRKGNIAYIGHPMDLDAVLPKVIDGTWGGKKEAEEFTRLNEALRTAPQLASTDPDAALAIFEEVAKKYPEKAETNQFNLMKAVTLQSAGKTEEFKTVVTSLIKTAEAENDARILLLAGGLAVQVGAEGDETLTKLGEASLQSALKAEPDNWQIMLQVASTYKRIGKTEEAQKLGMEAYESIEDEQLKLQLKGFLEQNLGIVFEKEEADKAEAK